MVPEIITGTSMPRSSMISAIAYSAALAFSVSKMVSTSSRSAPPSSRPLGLLAIGLAQIVEGHRAIAGIGDVGRDRGGAVGRAERAGDEALLAVLGRHALGRGAARRAPCRFSS